MTGTKRLLRVAFFALSPLALVVGLRLDIRNERLIHEQGKELAGDRGKAIAIGNAFFQSKGIDAAGWRTYCAALINEDLYNFLKANPGEPSTRIRRLAPAIWVTVMKESLDQRRVFVILNGQLQPIGFDLRAASMPAVAADTSDHASLQVAQQMVSDDPDLSSMFGATKPEVMTGEKTTGSVARKYTWSAPLTGLPDVEIRLTATVRNGAIASRQLTASVDPKALTRVKKNSLALKIFGISYVVFLCLVALYSIYTYAGRALQKEVSHSRTALLAVLVAMLFYCVMMSGRDDMVLSQQNLEQPFPLAFVIAMLGFITLAGGILVGIAYGSGEGDVREAYPGKLTALDALVTGRIFSRNVGRSIVIGSVFAAWLVLLHGGLTNLLSAEQSSRSLSSVRFPYLAAPWLDFLAIAPASAIIFAIAGLLQPLAFLHRRVSNRKLRMALLILFATFALSSTAGVYAAFGGFAISTLTYVIGLLAPFFLFDLLTAMVALIGFQFFGETARISATLPGWTGFAIGMGTIAAVSIGLELLAWWKGGLYTEEEVRPVYARHIAERQELQAEVSAAREAQLRLLPQRAPDVPGLSIYASCLPAKVVGGDFYDFFPLGDQRLGIFIAEGGNRGLASALSIALAKGYLMHAARGPYSPTEVVLRLESTLGAILEAGPNRTTVAYAVLDARRRTLRYARTGEFPRIVVARAGHPVPYEREIPLPGHQYSIREASIDLNTGDSIFFYTDGIARRIRSRSTLEQEEWFRKLGIEAAQDAQQAHHELLASIDAQTTAQHQELEDDLTAIVIRCTRTGEFFAEGVA